ncbi:MAG: two-component hybrid sensor and regulator, partial [Verrucomicrobiaceae bacterium]|nr:two-component hybrid sensor and regulator [Verrucomicrobiaceae bacterium]
MKKAVPVPFTGRARPKQNAVAKTTPPAFAATFPIVGVGASAGGLEAFRELLKHLPVDTGMGFVLVQHLDPQHESALPQLLSRNTTMLVIEVTNDLRVAPNCIYVIPPNTCMAIAGGLLKLSPRLKDRSAARSIDFFFEALAQDQREHAIGVVLSGTATDGTIGLEMIKAEGGVTFAQDASAKYDSMPRSAVAAGCVDLVLSPQQIALELARIAKHPYILHAPGPDMPELQAGADRKADQQVAAEKSLELGGHGMPRSVSRRAKTEAAPPETQSQAKDGFNKVLHLLHGHCGVDFSLYKWSTIQRRVARRVVLNKQQTVDDYALFLKDNSKELDSLYSDVLISVTSFFRNPEAFDTLKRKVFPRLLAQRERDEAVRIWVLGCSTGQEAYSLAMTFAEAAADASGSPKLQIFATDLNEALLDKARAGLYAKSLAQDVSPERLRRFFVEEEGGYRVSKSIREQVVFARQNVISDPPFSRMNLITCRNLLIYLEPDLQKQIMPAFHYALKPGGFLFLGASESIGTFTELFAPADKKQKIFSKKAAPTPAFRLPLPGERTTLSGRGLRSSLLLPQGSAPSGSLSGEINAQREADRVSVSHFAPPGVLINAEGQVLQFRGATGAYLQPPRGKASFDLLKMAREGLMLPLRAAIAKALREKKPVRREGVRIMQNGVASIITLQIIPLRNLKEPCLLILFEDAEAPAALRSQHRELPAGKREVTSRIVELERELAETRDYLQSIQEQNDVANEELQVSSEEVQSANEELQSMNEELQTSKEELESTNEELITINDEMVNRNAEMGRLNADLNNLQFGIHTAILLLSGDLTIRRFTAPAEKIFNLQASDIGRGFGSLRHNLDLPGLELLLLDVMSTMNMFERDVRDHAGRWYSLCARPYLTLDKKIDGVVLVLSDIDALKHSELEIRAARDYAEATLRTAPVPFLVLRADLRVNTASEAFYLSFKVTPAETEGRLIYEIGNGQWNIPRLRELLEEIIPR